jgi:hypothetical protein
MLTCEDIAAICHTANNVLKTRLGEKPDPAWEEASQDQRQATMIGVGRHLAFSSITPKESHFIWCRSMQDQGWSYGPVKDAEKKTHPLLVPFEKLSPQDQAKDVLFVATVNAMAAYYQPPAPPQE